MTPTKEENDREMQEKLKAFRLEQDQKKAASLGWFSRLRVAKRTVEDAGAHPADAAEQALRLGVKALAKGAVRGSRAIIQGIADSQKELNGGASANENTSEHNIATDALTPVADWFTQTHARIDQKVGKIANSHRSLSMQLVFFGLRQAWRVLNWCGNTYPYILRPVAVVSRRLKAGLDRKIGGQGGHVTNMQKMRRRLYGVGPRKGRLNAFRYAAINMLTIPIMLTLSVDALYNYATIHEYQGVHVSQSNPQSAEHMYEYRVDGYQRMENGAHRTLNFDIGYSIWHPLTYPRNTAAEIQPGKICDFKAYGIPAVFASDFGILRTIPDGIRQLVNNYPVIIAAQCRPDPADLYGLDHRLIPDTGQEQDEPVRSSKTGRIPPVRQQSPLIPDYVN